jgi:NAD(P)-dependent dehydrogenase (short-subunit alcohol dehydrogenase family)
MQPAASPLADLSLAGRSVLVVGGASGIGAATAHLAAALGACVTIADIDPSGAVVAAGLPGAAHFVACDAAQPEQVERVVADVVDRRGSLDGVVTTVGGAHLGPIESVGPADWLAELTFNLTTAYAVARAALAVMRRQRSGAIVTTSSGYAYLPAPDRAGYSAAKAGVISLTRSLAAAAAADGVRVNCVAPGPTDTPRFRAMNGGDAGVERVRRGMPLGRIPQPIDCAWMAVFLLTDAARNITGQVVHVNGGVYMP